MDYGQMIDDIHDAADKLTEWEEKFLDNITAIAKSNSMQLTDNQEIKLRQIWNKYCN